MNEQRIGGVVGELIFAQRAAEMGFGTSFPMFLAVEYDVIIDTGSQLFRVQINQPEQMSVQAFSNSPLIHQTAQKTRAIALTFSRSFTSTHGKFGWFPPTKSFI